MFLHEDFQEKFAIVIPVYNEQDTIENTILQLESLDLPYIVIDDGSTDKTNQILYLKSIPHLTQFPNQGKGSAVFMGAYYLAELGYEWIMIVDGDGQFLNEDIERLDNELLWNGNKYSIFLGNRFIDAKLMPRDRYWANRIMSWIISIFAGQKIIDSQCGLRLIHSDLFRNLKLKGKRFELDSEILIKAGRAGYQIKNIPIRCIYHKDRKSKIRPIRDLFRFLKMLILSLFGF